MSDDNNQIDLNSPEIQALIQSKVDETVQGLKAKNDELLGKLTKKNSEFEGFKSQFADVDLEDYRNYKAKISQDETARLIAEGKIEEVLNQRVEALKQDYDEKLKKTAQESELYKNQFLGTYISASASKAGIDSSVIDIVSSLAQQSGVKLDSFGKPVITDKDGNIKYSKDGVTPMSLDEWFSDLRNEKPILWGQPQGAGAVGNNGVVNIADKALNEYTEQELRDLKRDNPEKFYSLTR